MTFGRRPMLTLSNHPLLMDSEDGRHSPPTSPPPSPFPGSYDRSMATSQRNFADWTASAGIEMDGFDSDNVRPASDGIEYVNASPRWMSTSPGSHQLGRPTVDSRSSSPAGTQRHSSSISLPFVQNRVTPPTSPRASSGRDAPSTPSKGSSLGRPRIKSARDSLELILPNTEHYQDRSPRRTKSHADLKDDDYFCPSEPLPPPPPLDPRLLTPKRARTDSGTLTRSGNSNSGRRGESADFSSLVSLFPRPPSIIPPAHSTPKRDRKHGLDATGKQFESTSSVVVPAIVTRSLTSLSTSTIQPPASPMSAASTLTNSTLLSNRFSALFQPFELPPNLPNLPSVSDGPPFTYHFRSVDRFPAPRIGPSIDEWLGLQAFNGVSNHRLSSQNQWLAAAPSSCSDGSESETRDMTLRNDLKRLSMAVSEWRKGMEGLASACARSSTIEPVPELPPQAANEAMLNAILLHYTMGVNRLREPSLDMQRASLKRRPIGLDRTIDVDVNVESKPNKDGTMEDVIVGYAVRVGKLDRNRLQDQRAVLRVGVVRRCSTRASAASDESSFEQKNPSKEKTTRIWDKILKGMKSRERLGKFATKKAGKLWRQSGSQDTSPLPEASRKISNDDFEEGVQRLTLAQYLAETRSYTGAERLATPRPLWGDHYKQAKIEELDEMPKLIQEPIMAQEELDISPDVSTIEYVEQPSAQTPDLLTDEASDNECVTAALPLARSPVSEEVTSENSVANIAEVPTADVLDFMTVSHAVDDLPPSVIDNCDIIEEAAADILPTVVIPDRISSLVFDTNLSIHDGTMMNLSTITPTSSSEDFGTYSSTLNDIGYKPPRPPTPESSTAHPTPPATPPHAAHSDHTDTGSLTHVNIEDSDVDSVLDSAFKSLPPPPKMTHTVEKQKEAVRSKEKKNGKWKLSLGRKGGKWWK
ncbi:hypothetical protein BC832DRAFT_420613 [Gaertneriomyces semiglobifer]|nr:hypothetical protein BC832DRAFT_420613 [Gaertneriomyces semiglobifer]